ncbi:Protein of unknown function [Streptomyces sp. DvalAA-14]|uniref:DUF4240 domain-containing protein n=1 Tax=unclassified Streptomyces TaxID=2593676 RepID=UPI00081B5268|nr:MULTISPECIES: DUF4240 domain-containing protein [unclassified Streptomyces]MYS21271.1 DUF4240 domain-containing protein [Streptomyces sp. SID4948]SCD88497.1 Protein of unknown function [Streptomyces sp. DvalAA-14]
MGTEEFWAVIESAREEGKPFDEALADRLARRSRGEILEFQERFDELMDAVYRWDVWAAAYLIGGGCSDDSFMDFRAGLIALGRDWFETVTRRPDDLADHPAVIGGVGLYGEGVVFDEDALYAASGAFARLSGGDRDAFYEAWDLYRRSEGVEKSAVDMGEDFDFDDAEQMRRRLPRLAALYLPHRQIQPSGVV